MQPKASIIIPAFERNDYIGDALTALRVEVPDPDEYEIIIVNDGSDDTVRYFAGFRDFKCILTEDHGDTWRGPTWAFNAGVAAAQADIIILTEPEIYQVDPCVLKMIETVKADPTSLVRTIGKRDVNDEWNGNNFDELKHGLDTQNVGYLTALRKEHYEAIGGFDEDFIGRGHDDVDLAERLIAYGLHYVKLQERIVHLWHDDTHGGRGADQMAINKEIYERKRGTIYRNGTEAPE